MTLYFATGDINNPAIPTFTTRESYVVHFIACAVVSFCIVTAIFSPKLHIALAVALFVAACGLTIELIQYYLPTRRATVNDVISDTLGAFAGATLAWMLLPLWRFFLYPRGSRGRPSSRSRRR